MKVVILSILLISALAVIPTAVTNCGTSKKIVFTEATFSVQPAKGVDETITLYGTASEYIELENVELIALWNGAKVFNQDTPNDKQYDKNDKVTYSQTANFPAFTPSGKIRTQFHFVDIKGEEVGCGEVQFSV